MEHFFNQYIYKAFGHITVYVYNNKKILIYLQYMFMINLL